MRSTEQFAELSPVNTVVIFEESNTWIVIYFISQCSYFEVSLVRWWHRLKVSFSIDVEIVWWKDFKHNSAATKSTNMKHPSVNAACQMVLKWKLLIAVNQRIHHCYSVWTNLLNILTPSIITLPFIKSFLCTLEFICKLVTEYFDLFDHVEE